jgi:hypothetical protein
MLSTSCEQGIPLQLIMAKTRHRNPRTAMRYVRPGAAAAVGFHPKASGRRVGAAGSPWARRAHFLLVRQLSRRAACAVHAPPGASRWARP